MPADDDPVPTLIEWAGGPERVAAMINAFYDRVEHDELLGPLFPGGVSADHRDHVALWWTEVLGGPARYTDERGGYPTMLAHHRDLALTGDQRLRFVTLMSRSADDATLPADPEFRAAIMSYLEWGTRLAVENSRPDAEPAPDGPVPRWGWGVAPPYRP